MKIFKATMNIYLRHIVGIFIAFLLTFCFYDFAEGSPYAFSLITTVIYIMLIYTAIWKVGDKDGRNITGFHPNKALPLWVSLYTFIVPFLLFVLRLAFPKALYVDIPLYTEGVSFFVGNCTVSGTFDLIYRIWHFHFAAFVKANNLFMYALQLFVLPIIICIGYFVGTKRFSIMDFALTKIMFKKKVQKK